MKIAPLPSGVLIELALAAAVVGAAVWAARRAGQAVSNAAGAAVDTAKQAVWAVTPWNNDNVIAQGLNTAGATLVTDPAGPGKNADGSWSLGGFLQDVFNPGQAAAVAALSQPALTKSSFVDPQGGW